MELSARTWISALAVTFVVAGCSKSAGPGQETPAPAQASPSQATPDECGQYAVDVELPEQHGCKEDGDCRFTEHRPGDCSGPLCPGHYRAGTSAWVDAVKALHERVCTGRKYSACIRVKCVHKKPERAVCKAGKCEIVFAGE
jgi:hypothetical protein